MTDWKHIETTVLHGYEDAMRQTPQEPQWHGEGDVWMHTRMVCEVLVSLPEYNALSGQEQKAVYLAAMLHDIGKTVTTTIEGGGLHAPHHAPTGSRMARRTLWTGYGLSGSTEAVRFREAVCLLVRYHTFPVHAIDMPDARLRLHRIAANSQLAPLFSVRLLCLLSKADMLGRIADDIRESLERIAFCEELACEEGCYETACMFPSSYTQHAFLSGREVWKEQELYDDTWGEVIMMSGLPGTGKDTWISQYAADIPMVSLDAIRQEKRIPPEKEQGYVANLAREQAKEHLRNHQPFVWNATNITAQMRESLVALFESYHARVRIVYLETAWKKLLRRNSSRVQAVPQQAVEKMLDKTVLPETREAQTVEWLCV
ncbi:MAG: AAA family ATPase [Paludibacteraceae bacterium]|nr:AAA family ATPase [Paludibacteraceae bacterium]